MPTHRPAIHWLAGALVALGVCSCAAEPPAAAASPAASARTTSASTVSASTVAANTDLSSSVADTSGAAATGPASSPAVASDVSATASGDVGIVLPPPTGDHPVGTALLPFRDEQRTDPLDPAGRPRMVLAQLWYPAQPSEAPVAPYAPPPESQALQQFYATPPGSFDVAANSRIGAPVDADSHPVVFFSHGLCGARTDSTVVAEQLASDGYVVVSLSVTGEDPAVAFPSGEVTTTTDPAYCTAGGDPFSEGGQAVLQKLLAARVDDIRFVADQLTSIAQGDNPTVDNTALPDGLGSALVLDRLGVYGHSFGGATAAAVIAADPRFVAGVNLDGFIIGPVATAGLDAPFLMVSSSYHDTAFDPSWASFLPALRGWHRWLQVTDEGHYRFIDLGGSVERWGLDTTVKAQDPQTWQQVFGDADDATSQQLNRDVVAAFFDEFLRDHPDSLTALSSRYPQLTDRTADIAPAAAAPTATG